MQVGDYKLAWKPKSNVEYEILLNDRLIAFVRLNWGKIIAVSPKGELIYQKALYKTLNTFGTQREQERYQKTISQEIVKWYKTTQEEKIDYEN